jgi:hypothetical protein
MLTTIRGFVSVLLVSFLVCVASAQGTITVTSPTNNAYLGTSNTLSFNISGATYQTTVTATITGPQGSSTSTNNFTPDSAGAIAGTLPVTFNSTVTGGSFSIVVTATSFDTTFNTVTIPVTVIVIGPKFLDFTPITGAYVTGTCHIRATISDAYLNDWTVQIDGADIPNNTGITDLVSVDWDTTTATNNSSHTITITATDLAGNVATENISVTVDSSKPTINMTYPQSGVPIIAGKEIDVIIDVSDVSFSALNQNGITVLVQTTGGLYLATVARVSVSQLNSTTLRWTGRIETQFVRLPQRFNIVASAIDLAGNVATPGTVTVTLR